MKKILLLAAILFPISASAQTYTVFDPLGGISKSAKVSNSYPNGAGELGNLFTKTNVLDFGAKGDGTSDDGASIANSITGAGTNGSVYFPYSASGYVANTGTFSASTPGHYYFNGNYLSGTALGDPGTCSGTIQSPYSQTCLQVTDMKFVSDPASVYKTSGTTNIAFSWECLPNKQNPNSEISGSFYNACIFRGADTGSSTDAGSKLYSMEIDNDELQIGTANGMDDEIDMNLYDTPLDNGISRWAFVLSSAGAYTNARKNISNGSNVWGPGSGWAADIEDTPYTLPSTSYTVVSTTPTGTQAQLGGSSGAWTLTFPTTLTKGYTVYVYESGNLISQNYISDWTTSKITISSTDSLTTSNVTSIVGVVPSYTSPTGNYNYSNQAPYTKNSDGSYTIHPRWSKGIFVNGAVNDVDLSEKVENENGDFVHISDANGFNNFSVRKSGMVELGSNSNISSLLQFSYNGTYNASISTNSSDALNIIDNTKTGAPYAIHISSGLVTVGENLSSGYSVKFNGKTYSSNSSYYDTNVGIQFMNSGTYTSFLGATGGNSFVLTDNSQTGVPYAITLNSGMLTLGEGLASGNSVTINGNESTTGTTTTSGLTITDSSTPTSTTSCTARSMHSDDNFIYVCTSSGTYKKVALGSL